MDLNVFTAIGPLVLSHIEINDINMYRQGKAPFPFLIEAPKKRKGVKAKKP